ncbi:MAG: TRAP transporter substrate-binding protein [Rhodobacterales bacterium]|nr:TRAP transporter substrate-binding protein [Rhodobacterales bacterium]
MGAVLVTGLVANGAHALELKLGHYAPASHPGQQAALMFADAVKARTGGAVTVKVYPAQQLGSPPEMLEQNIQGTLDMSLPTQGQLDKYDKAFAAVLTPFVYDDYKHAWRVLDGPFLDWVAPRLEKQGLVFLSNWEWGFRNVTNGRHPINTPADMKGLKMRTPPELQLQAAMEAAGAIVTKISFKELPLSLKQGVVDGQENPLSVIYHFKLYEVQPYLAITQHVYNSMVHVMSTKAWAKLTPEQQAIVREESAKAGQWMRDELAKEEAGLVEKLKEKGMQVTMPDRAAFRALMDPAYKRIAEYAGPDTFDRFMKMVEAERGK